MLNGEEGLSALQAASQPALLPAQFGGDVDNSERRKLVAALLAEFLGLFIFQLYGGEASGSA